MPDKLCQKKFHSTIITSVHIFVIEIHIGLFRNWNVTFKSRPIRRGFFFLFVFFQFPPTPLGFRHFQPLACCPGWGSGPSPRPRLAVKTSPPRAAATRMPFLGCVCLFSYVQVLVFYAIQKVTRKKGNSYSEFSTQLTSPPTGNVNSYKLITYKTLQYIHYVINTLL